MKVQAHLFDTETGERKAHETEWFDVHDARGAIRFQWVEGNYCCDCNRSIFLYGLKYGDAFPCNTGPNRIVLEKLVADGEEIEL